MATGFSSAIFRRALRALAVVGSAMLAACSHHGSGASQVVASVGNDEITETQVNNALERQTNIRPDQLDAAAHRVVSGLVEQQIVVQKARDLKLDRDDRVMENIEAMKRQLIASAYVERIAAGASKPSDKEVQDYFDANPVQFSQRRTYTFQELVIDATPEHSKEIQAQLGALKSAPEIAAYLKSKQIVGRTSQSTLAAENVPPQLLQRVSALAPGQGLILPTSTGLRVLVLLATQDSPVTFDQARSAIAAYLYNLNKRKAVEQELTSLRGATKVAFFGKYADLAASAPSVAAGASSAASATVSVSTAAPIVALPGSDH